MIPLNDFGKRLHKYGPDIRDVMDRVLKSGFLILGKEVAAFEAEFAAYTGATYCIGVANGTDAIELALRSVGIGAGDLVATVANAGMYTTTAIQACAGQPFFIDVDKQNLMTTEDEVRRAITAGVKAVVITHLYGQVCPAIRSIASICIESGVKLVEDCAQAHGANIDNQYAGTYGDCASFSFYPTKNLGAMGDGGAVITNTNEIAVIIRSLRQYGWKERYNVGRSGGRNSRLDEIQAAILRLLLPQLEAENGTRRQIIKIYQDRIVNRQIANLQRQQPGDAAHLYVIRTRYRESLKKWLEDQGIASAVHYPIPDHQQAVFDRQFKDVFLPETERACAEVVTLPCNPEMTENQVDKVICAVNGWRS